MPGALVVLTGTVSPPPGVPTLRLMAPEARAQQYLAAATWWARAAERNSSRVVLVDSSPRATAELEALESGMSELGAPGSEVGFVHHAVPEDRHREGKGVGEALLLREVARSHLGDCTHVLKCTGRLVVPNLAKALPRAVDGITCVLRPDLSWADSRLFVAERGVFERYLGDLDARVDEGRGQFFEHALARQVMSAVADGVAFRPFRRLPRFSGQSGSTGRRYDSPRQRLVHGVQDVVRARLRSRVPL